MGCCCPGPGVAVHLSAKNLAGFLSDDWLNDDMINAGSDFISRQLGLRSRVRILNALFIQALSNLRSTNSTYAPKCRRLLDELISKGCLDTLFIPLHVNDNHWTLLQIDLTARQYAYVDSMNPSAHLSPAVLDTLIWWLDAVQPCEDIRPFTISSQAIAIPCQLDSFSCGIVIPSTIACILLCFAPWDQQHYACECMEWFLRLSEGLRSHNVSTFLSWPG
jgi:Ulp1 family protease